MKTFNNISEMRRKLAEKNKEIKKLKADLKSQKLVTDIYATIAGSNATKMSIAKATRHQVCEEIRSCFRNTSYLGENKYAIDLVETIIDEVEQGENDEGL